MILTRIIQIDADHPDRVRIDEAADVLRRGGLVAFPTETVYGLGASIRSEAALAKVYQVKGRPLRHPLIAHVANGSTAAALAAEWPRHAERLAHAFWPGPLTLVVKRASGVSATVAGGGDSIAVRVPQHPIALALIRSLGEPIAAPSANRYQALSPTRSEHVARSLTGEIELIVDGGPTAQGIESTVVDVRGDVPLILRPGAIDLPSIRAVEPSVAACSADAARSPTPASPGTSRRHYAPNAQLHLVQGRAEAIAQARSLGLKARVAIVFRGEVESVMDGVHVCLLRNDARAYASGLFATLHALDAAGIEKIVVEAPPADERWWAIDDRLRRGAWSDEPIDIGFDCVGVTKRGIVR